MSRRPRTLTQRVRDHLGFSVVAIGVLFVVLRLLGVRSTFAGFALSVGITLALNVGLSYYNDHRARNPRPQREVRGGGDIRFREDERRDDPRDLDGPRDRDDPSPGHRGSEYRNLENRNLENRNLEDRGFPDRPRRRGPRDENR